MLTRKKKSLFLLIGVATVLCSLLMYVSSCSFGALYFCVVEIPHIRLLPVVANTPPKPHPPSQPLVPRPPENELADEL